MCITSYRLLVVCYWLFWWRRFISTFQVVHVAVQQPDGMVHELSSATNQFVRDQVLVATGDEMIENFPARTAGVAAELRVIEIMEPPVPLCDVRSRRTRGPQQLITEPVPFVLGQSWTTSPAINLRRLRQACQHSRSSKLRIGRGSTRFTSRAYR